MPSFSHLSQEMLDLIIDFCATPSSDADARRDMISCSLVCWALRPRAQSKIFSTIRIEREAQAAELHQLVTANPQLAKHIKGICLLIGSLIHEEYFIHSETASLLALLNSCSPTVKMSLHINGEDENDMTVPCIRKISPVPSIFSRLLNLTMDLLQHVPVEIFKALPPLNFLRLKEVTFYPDLDTLGDDQLEKLITICFSTIEILLFEDMSCVPGIMIASCPMLFELSLINIGDLDTLENADGRIRRPAPETIEVVITNYEGLLDTLTDIIDYSKLHYLIEKTGAEMNREDLTVEDAMAIHEELECILSKCNSPTSQLGSISLDFYSYVYPTLISEVGIDFSKLPTLSFLTMTLYCLEPNDDTNVLLHIRDILRTRKAGSSLVNMIIILVIPFPELELREDETSVIDADNLPAVLHSPIWNDIKEEWRIFALDANESDIPPTNSWNVHIKFVPMRVDDTPRMYTQLNIRYEDSIMNTLADFCSGLFPAIRAKAKFAIIVECAEGEEYYGKYSFQETDDGGEMNVTGVRR